MIQILPAMMMKIIQASSQNVIKFHLGFSSTPRCTKKINWKVACTTAQMRIQDLAKGTRKREIKMAAAVRISENTKPARSGFALTYHP